MVLTIKNRSSYYKRFNLDIWGIIRGDFNFYYISRESDTFEEFLYWFKTQHTSAGQATKLYDINNTLGKTTSEAYLDWFKTNDPIKAVSQQEIGSELPIIPWQVKSRKLSRILDFFYKNYLHKKTVKFYKRRRYIYLADVINRPIRRKRYAKRFVSLRLLKLFYIKMSYKQFIHLSFAMRKKWGNYEENYLMALEGRVSSCLYRTALIISPFHCIEILRLGYVLINFKCYKQYNLPIGVNKLITFNTLGKRVLYLSLLKRLAFKRSLFNPPRYMYVSYIFLYSFLHRPPRRKDLVFPIPLDLHRVSKYVF